MNAAPAPEVHPATHGVTLLVATELAAGSDSSAWAGLSVSGCVTLGPTCLGTLLRFWHDLDASDESANAIHRRDAGEIAISLDLPLSRGRVAFRPGVELGIGWIHMGGFGSHAQDVDDSEFDHGDVSAGAHVAASVAVWRHWSVEAGLGVSFSLFAHQTRFVVNGVMLPGEPLAYGLASLGDLQHRRLSPGAWRPGTRNGRATGGARATGRPGAATGGRARCDDARPRRAAPDAAARAAAA